MNIFFCIFALKIFFFDLTIKLNLLSWFIIFIIIIFLLLSILYIINLLTSKKQLKSSLKSDKNYNCKTYTQAVNMKIKRTLKLNDKQAD